MVYRFMERNLSRLMVISLLILGAGLWYFFDRDWFSVVIYLFVLAFLPFILYELGIKTIDPTFPSQFFLLAFIAKLIGGVSRYWMVVDLYESGDAISYHEDGIVTAGLIQRGGLSVFADALQPGSEAVPYISGSLYSILPANMLGSFLFFAGLAFIGSVLFYRAHRIAFPDTAPEPFRLVIFFLPSIIFWPSSLGKDALVFFGSGFLAYGLVKYIRRTEYTGFIWFIIGLVIVGLIRPHVAGVALIAISGAYILVSLLNIRSAQDFVGWVVGGAVIAGLLVMAYPIIADYLMSKGLTEVSLQGLEEFYYDQQSRLSGGSQFTPVALIGAGLIFAPIVGIVVVLLRPFPWEAGNPQAMISSLESLVWLALLWYNRHSVWQRVRSLVSDPWAAFLVSYSFGLIFTLTTIANFGLLARERVMVLPFVWMLLV